MNETCRQTDTGKLIILNYNPYMLYFNKIINI